MENYLGQVQKIWMNDTVQAEQLQASVLAHLAEDSDVGAVLDEVMSEYGSSMLLHDIGKKEYSTTLCLIITRKLSDKISVSTEKCSGFRVYALGCQFFTAKCSGLRV